MAGGITQHLFAMQPTSRAVALAQSVSSAALGPACTASSRKALQQTPDNFFPLPETDLDTELDHSVITTLLGLVGCPEDSRQKRSCSL